MIVIVDTEYTTWEDALETGWSGPGQHREIFQLSAIRVDAEFREVGSLDLMVKPAINPILSDFCKHLTGAEQWQVDAGVGFEHALMTLDSFLGDEGAPIICMNMDKAVMFENIDLIPGLRPLKGLPVFDAWHRLRPFLDAQGVARDTSSGDLHQLTDWPLVGWTHNSLHDVRSMAHWLRDAQKRGVFTDIAVLPTDLPERDHRNS